MCRGRTESVSRCLWIITVVRDAQVVLWGAVTLAKDGCALSGNEVQKAVTVEKRLEKLSGEMLGSC